MVFLDDGTEGEVPLCSKPNFISSLCHDGDKDRTQSGVWDEYRSEAASFLYFQAILLIFGRKRETTFNAVKVSFLFFCFVRWNISSTVTLRWSPTKDPNHPSLSLSSQACFKLPATLIWTQAAKASLGRWRHSAHLVALLHGERASWMENGCWIT